jgi:ornithine cyclodeaminase/alanine dehydrogenase-like protein (mu-crystallin family)
MSKAPPPALILSRSEVAALMDAAAWLAAVEAGFRSYASGEASVPLPMHIPAANGGFHAKGALVVLDRPYVELKLNGNFPGNPRRQGLPTIQGVVLLCDATDGCLLAVIDSIEITLRRTAAASALAARYLAREDASSLCDLRVRRAGRAQAAALADVISLTGVKAWTSTSNVLAISRARCATYWRSRSRRYPMRDATWGSDIIDRNERADAFLTGARRARNLRRRGWRRQSHKSELTAELLVVRRLSSMCSRSASHG